MKQVIHGFLSYCLASAIMKGLELAAFESLWFHNMTTRLRQIWDGETGECHVRKPRGLQIDLNQPPPVEVDAVEDGGGGGGSSSSSKNYGKRKRKKKNVADNNGNIGHFYGHNGQVIQIPSDSDVDTD